MARHQQLLLLTPSSGFGGGIERLAASIQDGWNGSVTRVDLYRHRCVERAAGGLGTKVDFALRSLRAARRVEPNVVLALHAGLLPVAAAATTVSRARLALFGIGTEVWGDLGRLQRELIGRCGHLLSISTFTRDVLAMRARVDRARIWTLPLAVDERMLALAPSAGSAPAYHTPMLLTVSRLASEHRYKGHRAIADGLVGLLAEIPDLRWFVVGDGDDLADLRRYCENLGIGRVVSFEQHVSDARLATLYARASAHVLPSVTDIDTRPPTGEGFGLVYAEAATFGIPSIASVAGGGALDFVEHGVTGLTVPVNDRNALTAAMRLLVIDNCLRRSLGRAARERVHTRHLPKHFAAALGEALSAGAEANRG